jgi:hypothetical protein
VLDAVGGHLGLKALGREVDAAEVASLAPQDVVGKVRVDVNVDDRLFRWSVPAACGKQRSR